MRVSVSLSAISQQQDQVADILALAELDGPHGEDQPLSMLESVQNESYFQAQQSHSLTSAIGEIGDGHQRHPAGHKKQQRVAAPAMASSVRQSGRASMRQLWTLMRQQVFLGMAASSVPVRPDVPNAMEDLSAAGVRFVYFSPRNMKRSKPVAEKIGLSFDWNCAISLRALDSDESHDPHRHISNYADWDVLGE